MSDNANSPFAFRFATPPLKREDYSSHHRIPSIKGMSKLTDAQLEMVAGGIDQAVDYESIRTTTRRTAGTPTYRGGKSDEDGGDVGTGIDF